MSSSSANPRSENPRDRSPARPSLGDLTAATRGSVSSGGLETSFLAAGRRDAPLVVLLHDGAWGGSAEASWGRVIPNLAEHFHVLAPDLYGYGRSSKMVQLDVAPYEFRLRQVAALLDSLALTNVPAHVVGNSFGGAMALRATTLPWFAWRVKSAVSIAGTGGPYRTKKSLESLAHFDGTSNDMKRIVGLLTGDFDGISEHVALRMRDANNAAHYRAVAAVGLPTPFKATSGRVDAYPENLRHVRVPLALIAGTHDDLVERGWAMRIAAHAPACSVHEVDGRHSPNVSNPETTAHLLTGILLEHENVMLECPGGEA